MPEETITYQARSSPQGFTDDQRRLILIAMASAGGGIPIPAHALQDSHNAYLTDSQGNDLTATTN